MDLLEFKKKWKESQKELDAITQPTDPVVRAACERILRGAGEWKVGDIFNPPLWRRTKDDDTERVVLDEETGIVALVKLGDIPLSIMKPKFERKADGHLGAVED